MAWRRDPNVEAMALRSDLGRRQATKQEMASEEAFALVQGSVGREQEIGRERANAVAAVVDQL